jgi:Rab GDP dissociation inhibitor
LQDESYDVIVLGTGLTECILSGLLSVEGKKVLHMDRNDYYGGESASLNLTQVNTSLCIVLEALLIVYSQLYKKFRSGQEPPEAYGRDRDYNVDLIPKFMLATGEFIKILTHTDVTRYLEFKQISGSYVYREGAIYKVPSSEKEAVTSSLFGLFEKRRAKKFFEFIQSYDFNNPATQQGSARMGLFRLNIDHSFLGIDLNTATMSEVYKKFGLEPGTQDFIGHSLALFLDDR